MTVEHRLIQKKQLVGEIAAKLVSLGFRHIKKSGSGSRYLGWPGTPFRVRVADHRWPLDHVRQHPEILRNVTVRPMPASEVLPFALETAVRFAVMMDERRGLLRSVQDLRIRNRVLSIPHGAGDDNNSTELSGHQPDGAGALLDGGPGAQSIRSGQGPRKVGALAEGTRG